jgi:hypothetical protein
VAFTGVTLNLIFDCMSIHKLIHIASSCLKNENKVIYHVRIASCENESGIYHDFFFLYIVVGHINYLIGKFSVFLDS